jgi:DNA-binding transcriptional ArsR family regulator
MDKTARRAIARKTLADLAKIRELVNAWDPIGLIALEAPEDEYDPEVRAIYRVLRSGKGQSAEELSRRIAAILKEFFGAKLVGESCSDVAESIWSWWQGKAAPPGDPADTD